MHVMKKAQVPCALEDGHAGSCRTPSGLEAKKVSDSRTSTARTQLWRARNPLADILADIRSNARKRAA